MKTAGLLLVLCLMLTTSCSLGHLAGGGRLLPCEGDNDCGPGPALPFSFNFSSVDVNKNGTFDEGDRLAGHFTLNLPAGRIHAKAVAGFICGLGDGTDCFPNSVANLGASPFAARAANLAGAPPIRDFIRLHPQIGSASFFGYFRLSGKNPDTCDGSGDDCRVILVNAFDKDDIGGPFNGDMVTVLGEGLPEFAGKVVNGNLSLTSEIVPAQ